MKSVFLARPQTMVENVVEMLLLGLCLVASVYGVMQLSDIMPLGETALSA